MLQQRRKKSWFVQDEAGVDREERDACAERSDGLGPAGKRAVRLVGRDGL